MFKILLFLMYSIFYFHCTIQANLQAHEPQFVRNFLLNECLVISTLHSRTVVKRIKYCHINHQSINFINFQNVLRNTKLSYSSTFDYFQPHYPATSLAVDCSYATEPTPNLFIKKQTLRNPVAMSTEISTYIPLHRGEGKRDARVHGVARVPEEQEVH